MATITSAATGNFSAGATWVGGVVPTVGDTAQVAAGHIVTIDVNTTCDAIQSLNTSGYFVLPNGITLTANVQGGATVANNGTLKIPASASATIVGNVTASQNTNNANTIIIDASGVGLTITGNVSNSVTSVVSAILVSSTGSNCSLQITGNLSSVGGSASAVVSVFASGLTLDILGDVSSGAAPNAAAVNTSQAANITITGTVTGSTAPSIVAPATTQSITVTGDVIGGSATTGPGILANGTITVTGSVEATTGAGIECLGTADIDVVGVMAMTSTLSSSAIIATRNNSCIVDGPIEVDNGIWPLAVRYWSLRDSDTTVKVSTENDGVVTYVNEDDVNGMPAELDVRDGIVYGSLGGLEGTLVVPDPQFVFPGVATDDTVGTGDLIGAVADVTGAQIVAAITAIP
jgi:hypothetical protein